MIGCEAGATRTVWTVGTLVVLVDPSQHEFTAPTRQQHIRMKMIMPTIPPVLPPITDPELWPVRILYRVSQYITKAARVY